MATLTKKHFESLAADIKWQVDGTHTPEEKREMERFVRFAILPTLRSSNPLFDAVRFLSACGFY